MLAGSFSDAVFGCVSGEVRDFVQNLLRDKPVRVTV